MNSILKVKNKNFLKWLPAIIVLVATLTYIIIWSYISIDSVLSLDATYFDLGDFMERLGSIPIISWNLTSIIAVFSNTGLEFFLFPIAYFHSYYVILILQSAAIGLCAIPIYCISRFFIESKRISVLISVSFLIYFPVAGSNYFDVHFQSFFPILFISGYYFYLRKNYKLSLLLIFLSGTVRYPYFIFTLLYAFIGFIELIYYRRQRHHSYGSEFKSKALFFAIILIFSGVFLLIRFLTAGPLKSIPIASQLGPYNAWDRIVTVVMLFAPLLFIPFLSKRWVLFFTPMLYLIFFGPSIYYFPMIFHDQYAVFIYPFIYLGFIEGISMLIKSSNKPAKGRQIYKKFPSSFKVDIRKALFLLSIVFIILIVLDISYEPYGPLNSSTPADYQLNQTLDVNMTEFNALSNVIKLIPNNNPYVLTQNNIIEIFPRVEVPPYKIDALPLIAGMLDIGQNLTLKEIKENEIPFNTTNGVINTNIDFVLADVNSSWYNFDSYGYPSMSTLISKLYASGCYGIVAEDNGVILLQRGYKGKIELFSGMYIQYSPSQLQTYCHASLDDGLIVISNSTTPKSSGLANWYGPYVGIQPGTYDVIFELTTTNYSKTNSIDLQVTEWPQNLAVFNITGSLFSPNKKVNYFSLQFSTDEFITHVEFRGVDAEWNGTLILRGINLLQLSA